MAVGPRIPRAVSSSSKPGLYLLICLFPALSCTTKAYLTYLTYLTLHPVFTPPGDTRYFTAHHTSSIFPSSTSHLSLVTCHFSLLTSQIHHLLPHTHTNRPSLQPLSFLGYHPHLNLHLHVDLHLHLHLLPLLPPIDIANERATRER